MTSSDAPRLIPSATVLLLRDGPIGLEVFMVVRHHKIDFAGGALVFPGGKLDPEDSDPGLEAHCDGPDGMGAAERAHRVAVIREAFEECGVLLARPRRQTALVDAARLAELETKWRQRLHDNEVGMFDMVRAEDLELATDMLVPFAHWITPDVLPKRFDTHFFLARAPEDHLALHDGKESVDSLWTRPADALDAADRGEKTLVWATRMNLAKLGRSGTVDEAIQTAEASDVVTVLPQIIRDDGEPRLRIPAEAGYDVTETPLSKISG